MLFTKQNKRFLLCTCAFLLSISTSIVFAETPIDSVQTFDMAERLSNIDPKRPVVALTFDDGPNNKYTNQVLDILSENNAKATFFMVGNLVESHTDTVMRVYREGHEIGNHSYEHPDLATLPLEDAIRQIALTNQTIEAVTGETPKFLRPPYGSFSPEILEASPLPLVNWSLDTLDWESRDAQSIMEKMENVQDGDVLLLHDMYQSTVDAMEMMIPELTKKGVQFVTLSDLFAIRGIEISQGEIYRNAYQNQ